jgi:hypothetical protein
MPSEHQGVMSSSTAALNETHAVKCELAAEVLRSSGSLRLRVTGWSMLPTIWPGDTLMIERADSEAVSEGDIVLCARNRGFSAHRVVSKSAQDSAILTRGDAMCRPDPLVSHHDLLGRVAYIVRNGRCIEPSKTLRLSERAVAALVQHSDIAARVVVGVHGLQRGTEVPSSNV